MTDQAEQDIEFVPSDELDEPDLADAEDAAVHVREAEEPRGLMTVEAEEFDAAELDEDVAEELEVEAQEAVPPEGDATENGVAEHEEDLEEILQRHYGIVSVQPEAERELEAEAAPRPRSATEFVCPACFLRKPAWQLADPDRGVCVDCAAHDR